MCNQAVDYYTHASKFVSDYYKTHEICNNAVNTYASTIQPVPEYYKIQEIYDPAVNTCFLYFILFLSNIKLKKCVTEAFTQTILC